MADNLPHRQDASRPRTGAGGSRSAIFLSPGATYHADRCEPLRQAVARGAVRLKTFARRGYPGKPLPPRMLPEISTVGFWDATGPQGWGLDWHRNEGIELTYLARGKTEFLVEQESFLLESGHLTVTRPWQEHRVGNPNVGACRLHWLILDVGVRRPDQTWRWPAWLILPPADLRRLTTLLSHNEQPVWRANAEIGECFEKIAKLVEGAALAAVQTRLQLYINELFLALLELLQQKNVVLDAHLASTRRSVEMFLSALPQHVAHPWTLDEMAYQCGLGAQRFRRLLQADLESQPGAISDALPRGRRAAAAGHAPRSHRHRSCPGLRLSLEPVLGHGVSAPHGQNPARNPAAAMAMRLGRNRQDTMTRGAKGVETARAVLEATPQGQAADAAFVKWLMEHQKEAGVFTTVSGLVDPAQRQSGGEDDGAGDSGKGAAGATFRVSLAG